MHGSFSLLGWVCQGSVPCFAFPFPLHGHFCGFQLLCEQNHDARLGAGLRVGLGCRFSWEMVKSGIVGLCGQDLTWQGSAGANQLLPARTRTHVWSCLASSLHQGRPNAAGGTVSSRFRVPKCRRCPESSRRSLSTCVCSLVKC